MKEFKFNANLCAGHICPADNNYVAYKEARKEIQNMQGLHAMECPYVEVIIRVPDPRQDWIDEWYSAARKAEKEGIITIRHCKDATFVCAARSKSMCDAACAAPRHGDKYDQRTGIAVAYAKICIRNIPDYI